MKFSESLKKSKDFQNVYNKGNSYANRLLVMYVLELIAHTLLKVYLFVMYKHSNLYYTTMLM